MEQKSYFKQVFRRANFKLAVASLFFQFSSIPRLILEVFLRRNMGQRYFSFGTCVVLFVISLLFLTGSIFSSSAAPDAVRYGGYSIGLFGFIFFYFANRRRKEIKVKPHTVTFDKFSLSTGDLLGFFENKVSNGTPIYRVEKWYEPLPFFLAGIVLTVIPFTRVLGVLLVICSIFYSFSYVGAYALSRDFIMDKIDEKIAGEEMGTAIKEGLKDHNERGFRNRAPLPDTDEHRQQLYDLMMRRSGSDEEASVAI